MENEYEHKIIMYEASFKGFVCPNSLALLSTPERLLWDCPVSFSMFNSIAFALGGKNLCFLYGDR